jgi:hypothetical protein
MSRISLNDDRKMDDDESRPKSKNKCYTTDITQLIYNVQPQPKPHLDWLICACAVKSSFVKS